MTTKATVKHDPIKFTLADVPMPDAATRGRSSSPLTDALRGLEVGGKALLIENPRKSTSARVHQVAKRIGVKLAIRRLEGGQLGVWRVSSQAATATSA